MKTNPLIHDGLLPKTPDNRDHLGGSLFDLPRLADLPVPYIVEGGLPVKNQGGLDFCAGYSSCSASEFQEMVQLEPSFTFMMSKVLTGDPEAWGQQLRDIARAHVKYGALETSQVPTSMIGSQDREKLVGVENWGQIQPLLDKSIVHKKESFFAVTGPYDHFDNIAATLWKFRDQNRAIIFGTLWDNSWGAEQRIIDTIPVAGFGHALCIVGFTQENGVEYLVVQNSWGDNGIHGRHLFTREVINHAVEIYGAIMFSDIPVEKQAYFMEAGIKAESGWMVQIIVAMWKAIVALVLKREIAQKLLPPTPEKEVLPYVPPTPVEPIILVDNQVDNQKPILLWDTKANVRHFVRVMCDEAGLTVAEKNIITACIKQESDFMPHAIGKPNSNGTRDYGLAQYNDGKNKSGQAYWIGAGAVFRDIDEVLNDPEKNVRVMISEFKRGNIKYWASYSTGAYKKWLSQ